MSKMPASALPYRWVRLAFCLFTVEIMKRLRPHFELLITYPCHNKPLRTRQSYSSGHTYHIIWILMQLIRNGVVLGLGEERTRRGTSTASKRLHRYIGESTGRLNCRVSDAVRKMGRIIWNTMGKRLTRRQLMTSCPCAARRNGCTPGIQVVRNGLSGRVSVGARHDKCMNYWSGNLVLEVADVWFDIPCTGVRAVSE